MKSSKKEIEAAKHKIEEIENKRATIYDNIKKKEEESAPLISQISKYSQQYSILQRNKTFMVRNDLHSSPNDIYRNLY